MDIDKLTRIVPVMDVNRSFSTLLDIDKLTLYQVISCGQCSFSTLLDIDKLTHTVNVQQ